MLASFTKPFLFTLAFIMATFSTSILPVAAANATNNNGGNDGFIKVNGTKFDDIPNNEPHVGCSFTVEFYNYDRGLLFADVDFELQNPTKGAGYSLNVTGNENPFIGWDDDNGSNDLDGRETYTLGFTGAPHPNQGYKVKLTVQAPGTNGNDTKTKVFWVKPCAKPNATATPTSCTDRQAGTGTVVVNVANPNVTSVIYSVKLGATTKQVTLAGGANQNVTFTGVAPGTHNITINGNDNSGEKTLSVKVDSCAALAPTVSTNATVCNDPLNTIFVGEAEVTITNSNFTSVDYKVTLGGVSKNITIAGQTSSTVTFTGLANGSHAVTVEGSDKTNVQTSVNVAACSPLAAIVTLDSTTCSYASYSGMGSAKIAITNPNSYGVTYQVTLGTDTQSVVVASGATQYVTFAYLTNGTHSVTVAGSNNTSSTLSVDVPACPPAILPIVDVTPGACVATGAQTGQLTVTVTNDNNFDNIYDITVNGVTKQLLVLANTADNVTFTGLAAGTYTAQVKSVYFRDIVSVDATVDACPVVPATPSRGQTLGTSTTKITLPKTGSEGILASLLAVLAAATTYGVVLTTQKRFANSTK